MKKNILLFIFLIYGMLTYSQHAYKPEITSKDVKYNIDRLASDEWAGRKPGTPGVILQLTLFVITLNHKD